MLNAEPGQENSWFTEYLYPHEAVLRAWLKNKFPSGVDIDDIVQEAYLKVMKANRTVAVKAPKAFLFATARNVALNAIRYSNVRAQYQAVTLEDCDFLNEGCEVRETVARNQELEILTKAIQSLPDRCRQIFTLRKVYGMSQREIAKKLNISANTVNAQIAIGVSKCADFVERFCASGKV